MRMPSINWCGSYSISKRSLHVPGSDSSALMTMYLGLGEGARDEAPFHSGGESRAAATAQGRNLYLLDDRLGRQLACFQERLEAVVRQIGIELFRIFQIRSAGSMTRVSRGLGSFKELAYGHQSAFLRPSINWSSCVRA